MVRVGSRTVLVPGKAVAVLLADRSCQFYLVSVYFHPDHVRDDLRAFVRAWTQFDKVTSRAIICGDFNKADRADREGWELLLSRTATCDVAPELMTHVSACSTSNLDRCLISEDWISAAQWNPLLRTTHARNFGHMIVQMQLRVRPTVLNNPRHPKHETIPASVFMPGKDGTPAQVGTEALQGLVRLLQRTRARFDRVNVVFPSVTPVKVNRPVVLQLLGNLGPYCTRFVHCRVWLNGVKLDTLMVDVQHGFYILVQLPAAPGVDAVMAKEATDSIVGHGRFLHLVSAPGVLIVHCPGGRTLLHSRSMQLTQHFDLPDPDVLVKARDEWPDLLGMALRTVHVHHSVFMFVVSPAEVRTVELVIPADLTFGLIAICLSLRNDGGVFTQRFLTLDFLLQQLGLSTWCTQTDLTCECFHNGEPLTNAPRGTYEGDFVGCWFLTRSPIEEDAVCACSESAEEESDDAFESNHTVPASPRAPARKRAFPGPSSAASPTTGLSSGDRLALGVYALW